jgi:hypothetical protein
MTAADYKNKLYATSYQLDVHSMFHTYWSAFGNADKLGITGNTKFCGSTCRRYDFKITSNVAQTIYVVAAVHKSKEYGYNSSADEWYSDNDGVGCNSAFILNKLSSGSTIWNYCSIAGKSKLYNDGEISSDPLIVKAGSETIVVWEYDWTRSHQQPDMALNVWAEVAGSITITNVQGDQSVDSYPLYDLRPASTKQEKVEPAREDQNAFDSSQQIKVEQTEVEQAVDGVKEEKNNDGFFSELAKAIADFF